ncbi:MAG: hypothetical protein RIQ52_1598 [Pseudomonadota bacterium]|jgi:hypothetical protein
MSSVPLKITVILTLLMCSVSGCSLSRKPAVPQEAALKAQVPGLDDVRYIVAPEDIPRMAREGLDSFIKEQNHLKQQGKPIDPMPPATYLALSGGGDDGAFGAGLLNGWSKTGHRPEFKMVTGVSTGALLAPFAFLGPSQDSTLETVYTRMSADDILEPRGYLAALSEDALADNAPLEQLVKHYVTQDILDQIAKEYAKGRLLLIATTNLDARQAVIWNMTRIAASHHPSAMQLFHQIMLASAAIPGAFPPSMIDVEVDGQPYQEMHVDGGAMTQVFLYPPSFNYGGLDKGMNLHRPRELYLIRNARLDPDWAEVQRQTLNIAGRAISSLIQTQGIGDLYRIYAIAQRDHISYQLAYIPKEFKAEHKEEFDTSYMRALYAKGFDMAIKGYPWQHTPPDY